MHENIRLLLFMIGSSRGKLSEAEVTRVKLRGKKVGGLREK